MMVFLRMWLNSCAARDACPEDAPTKSEYAFGPEMAVTGFEVDGKIIELNESLDNYVRYDTWYME